MGSSASKKAAEALASAENRAMDLEQANLTQTTQNLQPYMTAGTNALTGIQQMLGIGGPGLGTPNYNLFTSSPGYQFALNQGNQNIQNSAVAGGGMTGNTLKALQQFGQQQAGTGFQQFLGNLGSLSQSGQTAATNLGNIGANVTANIGSQAVGAGQAQAAGILGQNNALTGGVNGALSAFGSAGTTYAGNQQIMALLAPYLANLNAGGGAGGGGGGNVFTDMGF
jgi:hypothetical protein